MEVCKLVHTAQPNYSAYKLRKQQRSCMLTFHFLVHLQSKAQVLPAEYFFCIEICFCSDESIYEVPVMFLTVHMQHGISRDLHSIYTMQEAKLEMFIMQ